MIGVYYQSECSGLGGKVLQVESLWLYTLLLTPDSQILSLTFKALSSSWAFAWGLLQAAVVLQSTCESINVVAHVLHRHSHYPHTTPTPPWCWLGHPTGAPCLARPRLSIHTQAKVTNATCKWDRYSGEEKASHHTCWCIAFYGTACHILLLVYEHPHHITSVKRDMFTSLYPTKITLWLKYALTL